MAEKIIDPDDHLSDIVATRRFAYLDDEGVLQFTDALTEAEEYWHAEVVPGDYVAKTLPLKPPAGWEEFEPPFPGELKVTAEFPGYRVSPWQKWIAALDASRNGVEIVVASIMAGTTGALIGWAIAHAG